MLKVEINMDESKIAKERRYLISDIYTLLDRAFLRSNLKKQSAENGVLVYVGSGSEQDYAAFWKIIWGLSEQSWFIENVKKWLWYNSDEGENENDFSVEDILDYCRKKRIGA